MGSEINLSSCCRTCLRTSCGLTPLNADDGDSVKINFKLMSCISEIVSFPEIKSHFNCNFSLLIIYFRSGYKITFQSLFVIYVFNNLGYPLIFAILVSQLT